MLTDQSKDYIKRLRDLRSQNVLPTDNLEFPKAQNGMYYQMNNRHMASDAFLNALKAGGASYLAGQEYSTAYYNKRVSDPEEAQRRIRNNSIFFGVTGAATSLFNSIGENRDYNYEMRRLREREARNSYNRVPYYGYEYDQYADNSFNNVAYEQGGMVYPDLRVEPKQKTQTKKRLNLRRINGR